MKINGWRRIWIVTSVVLAALIGSGSYLIMPSTSNVKEAWATELKKRVVNYYEEHELPERTNNQYSMLEMGYITAWRPGDVDRIRSKYSEDGSGPSLDFSSINERFSPQLRKRSLEKTKLVAWTAIVWVGACAGLYAFGATVAWVVRGFKDS